MNRLQEQPEPERKPAGGDYFVVSTQCCTWYVSTEMARHIEASLDAEREFFRTLRQERRADRSWDDDD